MAQFNFDPINYGLGVASGVLTTLAVQRVARYVRERDSQRERAVVRTYASREADRGYLTALIEQARKSHLFGHKIRLDDILVEPRFIPPPDLMQPPEDDVPIEDVFDSLPMVHDYPYLYAPYNMQTLSIDDLSRGAKSIVMIGTQGSGRTTALLTIALWSAGYLEFAEPRDDILTELEDNLDPKKDVEIPEQVRRIRLRVAMSESTRDRYQDGVPEDSLPKDPTEPDEDVAIDVPSRFREIAPLYVHLANVVLESGEYGHHIDPAEPFVRALQHQAGWLSSKRLVNKTYKLLEAGSGLVLIDGYDDLPMSKRQNALRWLQALMALYPDNFFIVAMPPEGYGSLLEAGAVPIYLRPWHDQNISDNTDKIEENWKSFSKQAIEFDREEFDEIKEYTSTIKHNARQLHALDCSLRTWTTFKGLEETSYGEQMQTYLEDLLPDAPNIMPELQRLASVQLDNGFITIENLITYALQKREKGDDVSLLSTNELSTVDEADTEDYPDYSEFFSDDNHSQTVDSSDTDEAKTEQEDSDKDEDKLRKQITREQETLLSKLVKAGVLLSYRGGRYQFRHKILASYLAACDLATARAYTVVRKSRKPEWSYAMNYLAEMRNIDFLVAEQLDNSLDVRLDNILKLTTWLKFAGEEASWRNNLLRYLGNMMAAPNQFTIVRERIAAALVSSKDEGTQVLFRQSMKTGNSEMRRLASLALGVLRDDGALDALTQIATQDPVLENKIASVLAITAIGSREAWITSVDLLEMATDEETRRAITENLASNREIGYPTLYDALESDNIPMRRAALFGVARINTDWSWIAIDRRFQEDSESYVRLASEIVLQEKFESYFYQLEHYPEPSDAPWLVNWVEEQKDLGNIPYDMEIKDTIPYVYELSNNDIARWLMTSTIGQLGLYDMTDKIYQALNDQQNVIRDTAYRALAEFQEKLGVTIPAPIAQ